MNYKHGNNLYRTCLSKRKYRTLEIAEHYSKKYTEQYGVEASVYYCPYCFHYHLTTKKYKKKGENK